MLTRVGVPVEFRSRALGAGSEPTTLICFSHLRWNFVFQRPQHLMSRFAREMNVIYWEEPVDIGPSETAYLKVREAEDARERDRLSSRIFPQGMPEDAREAALKPLARCPCRVAPRAADRLVLHADDAALLARTSMPIVTVFDAMDELSKFHFAPAKLLELEQELIDTADIVFTGGSSLYEAKKDRHPNVHCFPSSVDRAHFAKARARQFDPADQEDLPQPRLGFYGVIDERFDTELLDTGRDDAPGLVVRDGRAGREDLRG